MKIGHITTSMHGGGVTSMLRSIIGGLDPDEFQNTVICLRKDPLIADELRALGTRVVELGLERGQISPRSFFKVRDVLKQLRPQVIQGWMYHGNALASLACAGLPVLWGIHHTLTSLRDEKPLTQLLIRSGPSLSARADMIVYCSQVSKTQHEALGYPAGKSIVIPNGFSSETYRFDIRSRKQLRQELGIPPGAVVFGNAARFHPMKNHRGLIEAFGALARTEARAWLALCGRGMSWDNPEIAGAVRAAGIEDRVRLVSHVSDMPRFYSLFDVYVFASSWGEAFPMVLGEAMLCELPCIATDVGDSRLIVGDAGMIIPPQDPDALVEAMKRMHRSTSQERRRLGKAGRSRIEQNYGLRQIVRDYAAAYRAAAVAS